MRNTIHNTPKIILLAASLFFFMQLDAQQYLTQDKNNTRPEVTRQLTTPPVITAMRATQHNGYNEIQWISRMEQDTRKFIVEYSTDGIYYQSAGEATATNGNYLLKHNTFEITSMLYRLRIEDLEGRHVYSQPILLEGVDLHPVKIYPTIISGNTVNVLADFPVERIAVIAANGQQVYTKQIGGQSEAITVVLPSLGKGMYWMHFIGQGWKSTSQFIVP